MQIDLYYINGISDVDTPYFSSLSSQDDYFDSNLERSIQTTFYPPHYRNVLRFDIEDVNFKSHFNYLSLLYNNKRYYYFINDIEYVNESIINVYVTMDVIQTYMFDIKVTNGVIERKHIKRWVGNGAIINRNYKRENVSSGIFEEYTVYEQLNRNTTFFGIMKADTNLIGIASVHDSTAQIVKNYREESKEYTGFRIAAAPLVESYTYEYDVTPTHYSLSLNGYRALAAGVRDASVIDMFIIPFNPFYQLSANDEDKIFIATLGSSFRHYDHFTNPDRWFFLDNSMTFDYVGTPTVYSKVYSHSKSLGFERNNTVNRPFDYKYVPCLIDENYIHVEFGSKNNSTSFPLHKLVQDGYYCRYFASFINGSRYYFIEDILTGDDKYKTMVVDGSKIGIEMINDAWNQYVATNRARWLGPIAQASKNIASFIVTQGGSAVSQIGAIGTETVKNNIFKQARNKKGQFTKNTKLAGYNISSRKVFGEIPGSDDKSMNVNEALSASLPIVSQLSEDVNALWKPSSITQTGDFGDLYSQAAVIYYAVSYVNDLNMCADFFRKNGYLVKEYVSEIDNIFTYVNCRYYFNALKMSDVNIHLSNIIEDIETVTSIEDRLLSGLRLWNVDNNNVTIGEIIYDNVESDYIQ